MLFMFGIICFAIAFIVGETILVALAETKINRAWKIALWLGGAVLTFVLLFFGFVRVS